MRAAMRRDPATAVHPDTSAAADRADRGVEGNRRMTASTGLLLILLLAVEGVTVLRIRQLIAVHVFVGLLLVLPVLWKMATTGYRFTRYYRGADAYVRSGPPPLVLRALGPLMIITTVALLATGIMLIVEGPGSSHQWLFLHQVSFFAWVAVTTVHVLGHLRGALRDAWRDLRPRSDDPVGRRGLLRTIALIVVLLLGVGVATAVYPAASAWTGGRSFHGDHGPQGHPH